MPPAYRARYVVPAISTEKGGNLKIKVATCQFPVGADIQYNRRYILAQMRLARKQGATVAHFPEACLSGYAGKDFPSYKRFNWDLLEQSAYQVLDLARQLGLWVVLGSTHRLSGAHKPHNSLYIINAHGELVDRYDKMFCGGDKRGQTGDLAHYSPGGHFSVFEIGGVRCGTLICHEYRYPELYREYKRRGVQLMFHSYHAGHIRQQRLRVMRAAVGLANGKLNPGSTIPEITMPAGMHSAAANNYMWISCPNSSARESCWPSFFVRPDGVVTGRLVRHRAGILISVVDTSQRFYDSTVAWRERAMNGIFHSGRLVGDKRSQARTRL
jgi:deaminated glutathione amidase